MLRSPSRFVGLTRAAQQESKEGAVQDAILYRVSFERDVWRWAGSGLRIASCNWVEEDVWGGLVASQSAIALPLEWSVRMGIFPFNILFPCFGKHKSRQYNRVSALFTHLCRCWLEDGNRICNMETAKMVACLLCLCPARGSPSRDAFSLAVTREWPFRNLSLYSPTWTS